jgi:hypothetical protein
MHGREERKRCSERMRWCGAAEERSGRGGAAAAEEEQRLRGRRCSGAGRRSSRLGFGGSGERRIEKKTAEKTTDRDVRLRRGRSAFKAMTGRAGRLTGHGGAASGQSPVSSWRDRTRPVRDDRTRTESGQRLPGNPTRMTGRGGGVRDRTQWSQHRVWSSVQS